MNARIESEPGPVKNRTTVERKSDREVVVTRTINGPARIVFEAFTKAELLKRWWVPKSMGMTLLSCEVDARVGGKYRLVFDHGGPEPAAFFGTYVEVKPYSRLAWTNEEGGEGGPVTTVTFEEKGGKTLVVLHESYPSKEALDAAGTGAHAVRRAPRRLPVLRDLPGADAADDLRRRCPPGRARLSRGEGRPAARLPRLEAGVTFTRLAPGGLVAAAAHRRGALGRRSAGRR